MNSHVSSFWARVSHSEGNLVGLFVMDKYDYLLIKSMSSGIDFFCIFPIE